MKNKYRKLIVIANFLTILVALIVGGVGVLHSHLFDVKVVEVEDLPDNAPLSAQEIMDVAHVPLEEINLFSLRLEPIKNRLVSHPWIKQVRLSKKFPQTVGISVVFREPVALFQDKNNGLFYVDSESRVFAPVNLELPFELPVILGVEQDKIQTVISFLQEWKNRGLSQNYSLSSVELDREQNIRFVATYDVSGITARSMIEFGQSFDTDLDSRVARLQEVLRYLQKNNIKAHHVFANLGKKIVVRFSQRS